MKKKSIQNLQLSKKVISTLQTTKLQGGAKSHWPETVKYCPDTK